MKWSQRPFKTCALICVIIGLMPFWQHVTVKGLPPGESKTKNIFTLGIPSSPLFLLERSHSEQASGSGAIVSAGWSFRLEFFSLSMAALVVGLLLLMADRSHIGSRTN